MGEDSHQELQNPARWSGLEDALCKSDLNLAWPTTTCLTHLGKQDMTLPKMSILMVLCRRWTPSIGTITARGHSQFVLCYIHNVATKNPPQQEKCINLGPRQQNYVPEMRDHSTTSNPLGTSTTLIGISSHRPVSLLEDTSLLLQAEFISKPSTGALAEDIIPEGLRNKSFCVGWILPNEVRNLQGS